MYTNETTIFAEELVMFVCRQTGYGWWKPRSWLSKPRNVSHDKFTDRIGDVVYYLVQLHWSAPEIFRAGIEDCNDYLFEKFFKYGYDTFNMFDYFAQLLSVGILCKENGQLVLEALDFCVEAIERATTQLSETENIRLADIWNELRQTAEKIDITYRSNVVYCAYL